MPGSAEGRNRAREVPARARRIEALLDFVADPRAAPHGPSALPPRRRSPRDVPRDILEAMALDGGAARGDVEEVLALVDGDPRPPVPRRGAVSAGARNGLSPREAE